MPAARRAASSCTRSSTAMQVPRVRCETCRSLKTSQRCGSAAGCCHTPPRGTCCWQRSSGEGGASAEGPPVSSAAAAASGPSAAAAAATLLAKEDDDAAALARRRRLSPPLPPTRAAAHCWAAVWPPRRCTTRSLCMKGRPIGGLAGWLVLAQPGGPSGMPSRQSGSAPITAF